MGKWHKTFEIPARVKTDLILNNYLTQTMENNARSGVRRVQAEMSFSFISLDQSIDYVNRSSKRLRLMNCFDRSSKKGQ